MEQLENRSLLAAIGNGLSAAPDYYSLDEDTTLNVSAPGVLSNDSGTSATQLSSPQYGSLSFSADGSFTYTPLADFYGTDSFTYQALEGELISDEITVTLTVNDVPEPPPPAPVAGDDTYTADEDTPLTISGAGVLDNDQGQSITAAVTSGPANGSVTMNPDGSFTYSPNADFNGSDSFAYTVTDSASQTDDAQVTITVNAVNDPPVALDLGFSAYEDQQLTVYSSTGSGLLYGATDPDNDWNLTPQLVSQASNGYVDFSYYGSFIYTPAAEFSGIDTFTYQISDGNGGYSNIATVTIQVDPTNDAPVAAEDYFTLAEDDYTFSGNLLTNDSDIDSSTFSPTLASNVSNGNLIVQMDGSFVYNPYANFFGTDSFTYYVSDGLAQSNTVTVWLTITEVNDAPIGAPDSYTTSEDSGFWMSGSSGVVGNDYDVETHYLFLTATLITPPANGTFWLQSDGGFQYTPNQDYYGEDTFTYQASDGQLLSEVTTVTITVLPINDTPTATDQSYNLDEDTPLNITDPNLSLLAGASDVDGPALSVSIYNSPQFGQITGYDPSTGAFTYIPNENYFGSDYFTYIVSDGSASSFATATLAINSVNDAPNASADSYATDEDSALIVPAQGVLDNDSDIENDVLVAVLGTGPAHGTLIFNSDGSFSYIPFDNYNGADEFTYSASDGSVCTAEIVVSLQVAPINDAPTAEDDEYDVPFDPIEYIEIDVLGNDHDPEGDPLQIVSVEQPDSGYVSIFENKLRFYPAAITQNAGDPPADQPPLGEQFVYTVADPSGELAQAEVKPKARIWNVFREYSRGNDDPGQKIFETARVRAALVVDEGAKTIRLDYLATATTGSRLRLVDGFPQNVVEGDGVADRGKPEFEFYQPTLYLQTAERAFDDPIPPGGFGTNLVYAAGGPGGTLSGSLDLGVYGADGKAGTAVIQMQNIGGDGKFASVRQKIRWQVETSVKDGNVRVDLVRLDVIELELLPPPDRFTSPLRWINSSFKDHDVLKRPYPSEADGFNRDPANRANPSPVPDDWNETRKAVGP